MSAEPRMILFEEQSREEWLAERKKGIGSSDISAIIGADPYRGPLDVFLDKTGRDAAGIESRPMRLGRKLEPIILAEFTEETGLAARRNSLLARHPSVEIAVATIDAQLVDRPGIVELKAPGIRQSAHWGRSWSEEYPEGYLAQCAWQMGVLNIDECYLAALIGGQDFRVYHIRRDRDLEEGLLKAALHFWGTYITPDVCPALDASEAARGYVERRFPVSRTRPREATEEEAALIAELAEARRRKNHFEDVESALENRLRERIGDAEGIEVKGVAKVSWKTRRGGISWKAVAETFSPPADLVEAHRNADTRVFRPSGPLFPSRREQGKEE